MINTLKNIGAYITQILLLVLATTTMAQSEVVSEDIILTNDSIQLPGTLTYNKTLKQQPLVIFIHGSGNVDRNGNQGVLAKANYIKLLSEALNKNDIAFYRYDKRTSNMANMKLLMKGVSFTDFVEDAKLAIKKFKGDNRFSSITLIGHSQGSLIAMLASKAGISKYISLAGPAKTIDATMIEQVRKQNGDSIAQLVDNHFKELKNNGTIKNVDPNLLAIFNKPNQLFFKTWMAFSPTEELSKLKDLPILILNGTKDLQVFESDANALHNANSASKLYVIENMNHVLKTIIKDEDNLKSYYSADYPLSEELVNIITKFIKK